MKTNGTFLSSKVTGNIEFDFIKSRGEAK